MEDSWLLVRLALVAYLLGRLMAPSQAGVSIFTSWKAHGSYSQVPPSDWGTKSDFGTIMQLGTWYQSGRSVGQ